MITIIIPAAGKGQRFIDAGYKEPKPFLDVFGQTMIERVIANLTPKQKHRFIIVCLKEHKSRFEELGADIVAVDDITEGAACTVLKAASLLKPSDELIIANCDQLVDVPIDDFIKSARKYDGAIMTFPSNHSRWSYARLNGELVTEVAEKVVISDHATVGIYYFKIAGAFVSATHDMIEKNLRVNGEFYLCPVYNEFIGWRQRIGIFEIGAGEMHGLGTPEDYQNYIHPTAFLFDLDGVLVDAPEWHYKALNEALADYDLAPISLDDHQKIYNGLPTKNKLDLMGLSNDLKMKVAKRKKRHTKRYIEKYCRPEADKIGLLTTLKEKGYLLGCVSNAVVESATEMLERAGQIEYFDLILGNDMVEYNKPHPEPYLSAMNKLGVTPTQTVIIEDSPHGIASAKASGARCIVTRYEDVSTDLIKEYI